MLATIVSKRRLNGTIDGHDPLLVTFKVKGRTGWFLLTVVTINLGRGYTAAQFQANLMRLLNAVDEHEYVVVLMQEIDEADPSPEHKIIRSEFKGVFGDAVQFVEWFTREPIVVIGKGVVVTHARKRMTMDQGTKIGADPGTGPRRFITYCRLYIEGVTIGVANQHPHRYSLKSKAVAAARNRGERITRLVLAALVRVCDLVIDGGDLNTPHYPRSHPLQKTAYQVALDYIRYIITGRKA